MHLVFRSLRLLGFTALLLFISVAEPLLAANAIELPLLKRLYANVHLPHSATHVDELTALRESALKQPVVSLIIANPPRQPTPSNADQALARAGLKVLEVRKRQIKMGRIE